MNSLIAPSFGIIPFAAAAVIAWLRLAPMSHGSGLCMRIDPDGSSHAGSGRNAESLVQQDLFQRRQEKQNMFGLAHIAHQADAPDLAFQPPNASGDFDTEFIEQLPPHTPVIHALG